jgi:hypothetical protein
MMVRLSSGFRSPRYLRSRGFYAHLELKESTLRAESPNHQSRRVSYEETIEAAIGEDALRRIEASLSEVQNLWEPLASTYYSVPS